jgi:hypothetical protein
MNDVKNNFHTESRMYDYVWVHNEKPIWIVEYPLKHIFVTYKVKDGIKLNKYKKLWAHDNVSLNKDGFRTLEEAMLAA